MLGSKTGSHMQWACDLSFLSKEMWLTDRVLTYHIQGHRFIPWHLQSKNKQAIRDCVLFLKILKFELGIVTNVFNYSIIVGIRGLGIQGQPQLHSKFKDSLVYTSPCLKKPK